jgi:general secretion pathway protein D
MTSNRTNLMHRRTAAVCAFLLLLLSAITAHAQRVHFDFQDADLRTVIEAVAEFTGKNFLIDARVKGKVTVVAPDPLTEEEAYQAFLSVLEVNGFVTVEADGITKILPEEEGRTRFADAKGKGPQANGDGMVTRVIRLKYAHADRLLPLLRPLVPDYGHLAADPDSASLIITDRSSNVKRLAGIIERLDQPVTEGEVELIALENASAEALAKLLNDLHPPGAADKATGPGLMVSADPRTNTLIVKGDQATRQQVRALAAELDTPSGASGSTHVVHLQNADAESLVEVLETSLKQGQEEGKRTASKVTITADPATNSLIVTASKAEFRALEEVIRALDIRRLQVYVEALIADVSTDTMREFGLQWSTADGLKGDYTGTVVGTNFDVGTSIRDTIVNPLAAGSGLSVGYIDGLFTLPDGTELVNLTVLAQALEGQNDTNVLSTPNILTMDNEEAEIVIGQNVPFVTGSYSTVNQGTSVESPFQTIERHDVGLTLRIRPQITEGSAIKMQIYQEVSSVAQRGEASDIVTNTRSLNTTVVAEDNRMLVLGGLIQDDITRNEQKVPLLGDIPLLGNLFRYKGASRGKTNLMVFLKPRIVRSSADLDGPTSRKYNYLGQVRKDQELDKDQPPAALTEWERGTAPAPEQSL